MLITKKNDLSEQKKHEIYDCRFLVSMKEKNPYG